MTAVHRGMVLAVSLLVLAVCCPIASAADATPARVLIVGDSVTQGYRGDFTWRYFAWRGLDEAGASVDFVGSRTGPFFVHPDGAWDWNYLGDDAYADPDFDQDHSAFYGGRLGSDGNLFYEPIADQVDAQRPDLIVSLWGINDLAHRDDGPEDLISTYRRWVHEARTVDPHVDFVVGQLPYDWIDEVPEFNRLLVELAEDLSTPTSTVLVAQMDEPYTRGADSIDRVHPTTEGQRKIARMMAGGIMQVLAMSPDADHPPTGDPQPQVPTPDPPLQEPEVPVPVAPTAPEAVVAPVDVAAAVTGAVTPGTPRRVRAHRLSDRRVRVSWLRVEAADAYAVQCGSSRRVLAGRSVTVRTPAARCRVRAISSSGRSAWVVVRVR